MFAPAAQILCGTFCSRDVGSSVIAVIAAVGFLALGKPFVALLLPPKYRPGRLDVAGSRSAGGTGYLCRAGFKHDSGIRATKYSAAANTVRLVLMIGGIWIAFAMFGTRQAIIALIIAQALSYFPLIIGLKQLVPEVVRGELRWYVCFLAILGLAALVPWPA